MPVKGFFTQSAAILLSRPASLAEVEPLLAGFRITRRNADLGGTFVSGPWLTLAFRPEANGSVLVNLEHSKWPDRMGDPQDEPLLYGAWALGGYGPFTFPGGLERAAQQSWSWPGARCLPEQHQAFLQIRSSYILGAGEGASMLPSDYDPLPELDFITQIALALLQHPAALAYFNPNGETLHSHKSFRQTLDFHRDHQLPPVDVWCNLRSFDAGDGWIIMDTVGMEQLDCPDWQACLPAAQFDLDEAALFLRNCRLYRFKQGDVVHSGDTLDGPGNTVWKVCQVRKAVMPPPRRLLLLYPLGGPEPPSELVGELAD